MVTDIIQEQVELYAKQLKIPTFSSYQEVLRRAAQNSDFGMLLLELMKREIEKRRENQNSRLLKKAGFPYTKNHRRARSKQI